MDEITDKLFGPHGLLKTVNIADVLRHRRYHDAIRREIDQIRRKVCEIDTYISFLIRKYDHSFFYTFNLIQPISFLLCLYYVM